MVALVAHVQRRESEYTGQSILNIIDIRILRILLGYHGAARQGKRGKPQRRLMDLGRRACNELV